jgi:hypothetical protein
MNGEFFEIDEVLIDRLVDGELSAEDRRRVIAALDARPDGWRRCALAFLEAQSFRGAMKSIVAGPQAAIVQPPPTAAAVTKRPASRSWSKASSAAAFWCAIAASLLVAFGLGWQANLPGERPDMQVAIDSPRPAPQLERLPATGDDGLTDGALTDDAVTLVVQNQNGEPQRIRVPLVEGSRLGQAFADAPRWAAPAVREHLQERGIDLQARRRYAPMWFEQPSGVVPMIVPVDDAVLTPVSLPVY